ncbi:hypothetical protein C5167_045291 [Papaver somniferum]|uniref:BTB domain-containing protein n=1 Tax=Papaver somniferum TaxID=3469 RepID=A0A4Y7LEA9_PAPSO|nr:BTB/POZ domain-containing protein At1g01640-like [Papaver somniferum]RZC82505.1 hypothetical protein C5167_045291 [Papaver somniferum]
MDCSFCKKVKVHLCWQSSYTPPGGVLVCNRCNGEINNIMSLMNKDRNTGTISLADADWGTTSATRWIKIGKEKEERSKEREERCTNYLGGLAIALREGSYSDIQINPGDGPSIPAHRFLLATRSEVFKNMLASDTCKAAPVDSVSLPEFNHEELEIFLELLYCGNLSKEKFEKHFFCLAVASHKYAIPHLQKFCEEHILKLLDSSTALKVLEISEITSNETLKVAALESILSHSEEIYFSPSYEEFASQNPHLLVHITRAHSISDKKRKV